jgi:TLC domain
MDKTGWTGTKWQLFNGICLIVCFFGCRIAWGWYQSVNLYHDIWSIWSIWAVDCSDQGFLGIQGVRHICPTFDGWLALVFLAANTTLSCLNLFWFSLMVRAMQKRFDPHVATGGHGQKN